MHPGDSLLYVLSARSEMEWSQFRGTVDSLRTVGVSGVPAAALRMGIAQLLDALAHVELVSRNGHLNLGVCKPSLVRLTTRQPGAVLAGSRGPDTYMRLSKIAEEYGIVSSLKLQGGTLGCLLPQVTFYTTDEEEAMSGFAKAAGLTYSTDPPAASLARFAGDLAEVASLWKWESSPDLNWDRIQFDPEAAYFRHPPAGGDIRLIRYEDPVKTTYRHWIWDGTLHCEVDPAWGRFWILNRLSYHILHYDKRMFDLIVPKTIPLPKLLARAAVLSSGEAPGFSESNNQAIYKSVPPTLAMIIACKLGQALNQFVHS